MKKIITLLTTFILSISLFACGQSGFEIKPDNKDDVKYATQNPLTVIEYNLLANREITVFTNQINTRLSLLRNLKDGTDVDTLESERQNAEHSKQLMEEALNSFATAKPPTTYEDERTNTIRIMEDCIAHLDEYIDSLGNGGKLNDFNDVFENDFISITAEASLYNQ